jgi:tetratricopeptide (TPR) repeat protein
VPAPASWPITEKASPSTVFDDEANQAWRRERIRAKIAKAYHELGRAEDAAAFESGLTTLQAVEMAPLNAARVEEHTFEAQMSAVESAVASGDLDAVCGALETCAQLFDRYFDDEAKRTRLENTLRTSWFKLPLTMCFDLMLELAEFAAAHGDSTTALQLAGEARSALDDSKLSAQYKVPMMARVAHLRHRAGDAERARQDAEAALALYVEQRDQVIDIYRAGALRPLAGAYHAMGDAKAALDVYKRAVEEGVANPNSRPRAEDLSATCLSLALHDIEPDEALAQRLAEIRGGLGNPW